MAGIFKKSVVREKAEKQVIPNFDKKVAIIQSWYEAFLSGSLQKKTERQCEQEFINDIFKQVLNYSGFPAQPHTIIPQISTDTSAQRPDAALGYFDEDKKRVVAVVEIKDANTALDLSQRREGNLSPIQQAFKYKPQFKDCRFVIATNLYEIRLFQDNQIDYEIFNLKTLANPANNYFELKRFILLLSKENFISRRGKSRTEELLTEISVEQEKITKKFYREYSDLRLMLMRDIWKNNKEQRKISVVADKSQKILDRIVFTSFCEDTGLLPENTLLSVYKHAESSFASVWDTLKGFFNAVDVGSEKLGIPNGYNGGLFHQDDILDNFKISDECCKALSRIGNYDFENELTVNVLGHVFEQSVTDLEEIKQKVEPDDNSQKSKRKKDGIFYTPEYVVDYIIQNSLGRYLAENESRIFKEFKLNQAKTEKAYRHRELKALQAYQDFLREIKVVDPACGSGAFLVKVFDYLIEENRRIGKRIGGLFDQDQIFREILSNNIFGVDLNEESVRITQLSLWLKTAQKGKKLTYLDHNIKCGNSLIDDYSIVGKKAFNWNAQFKAIMDKGGFDVVVGNPPYVSYYSKQSQSDDDTASQLGFFIKKYNFVRNKKVLGRFNTLMFFAELGINLLKKNGSLGFILDNNIHSNPSKDIRRFISENTSISLLADELNVFENVASSQLIISLTKRYPINNRVSYQCFQREKFLELTSNPQSYISEQNDFSFKIPKNKNDEQILDKMALFSSIVQLIGKENIRTCITFTGKKQLFVIKHRETNIDYPLLEGSKGVSFPYSPIFFENYVRYDEKLRDKLNEEYKELARMQNKRSPMVIGLGDIDRFKAPKLFIRLSDSRITATYTNQLVCADLSLYVLTLPSLEAESEYINLKYLLAVLNSKALTYFFRQNNLIKNLKTGTPQIRLQDIRKAPIPLPNLEKQREIAALADLLLELNHTYKKKETSILTNLKREFNITSSLFNKQKLLKIILQKNLKMSLSEKEELISYLDKTDVFIQNLELNIFESIKKIDEFVYSLFELTPEEIAIIEQSIV